jgi:hypothetical protein
MRVSATLFSILFAASSAAALGDYELNLYEGAHCDGRMDVSLITSDPQGCTNQNIDILSFNGKGGGWNIYVYDRLDCQGDSYGMPTNGDCVMAAQFISHPTFKSFKVSSINIIVDIMVKLMSKLMLGCCSLRILSPTHGILLGILEER